VHHLRVETTLTPPPEARVVVARRTRYVAHLVGRFFGSLRRTEPSEVDLAWVRGVLTEPEYSLWARLGRADRVESITTARRTVRTLSATPYAGDSRWVAAALLHDVGKAETNLGPVGRATATVYGWIRSPDRMRGRAGRYLRHAALGATALEQHGARPEVVAWAATHHETGAWPTRLVPAEVCRALAAADGVTRAVK
jgi:putative nucleotidyltransferase with HDIG domain